MWREWHPIPSISIVSVCTSAVGRRHLFFNVVLLISPTSLSPVCVRVCVSLSVCAHVPQIWRGLRTAVWECLNGTDLSSSFASDRQAMPEWPVSILTPRATRYTHTNKNTWCVCFVYLEHLCWSPCTPPAVWSCWWGGLPQSLAGQPDIVQPQTLPGELASRLLRHLPHHVCEHLQTKVPTCLLLCSRWQSWQCHTKTCGDFAFITSSSLIATAGQSNDNRSASVMSSTLILWCVRWY